MKLDRKTVEMLKTLPDDKLWQMIRIASQTVGISVSDKMPEPEKMTQIRDALDGLSGGDIERALRLIETYKGGEDNGQQ